MAFRIPYKQIESTVVRGLTRAFGLVDRNFDEVEKRLNLLPTVIFDSDTATQIASSTSTVTVVDKTNHWTAPVPGRLVVTTVGRVGFNASALDLHTYVGADNGASAGSTNSHCTTTVAAGKFGPAAVSHSAAYNAGDSVGFTISFRASIATGTNYLRTRTLAVFYPIPS